MNRGPVGSRASLGRAALAGVLALALSACGRDPEPFPYGITSLAVLPAEVIPMSSRIAGDAVGDHLTSLLQQTRFRVVGIGSTRRILSQPDVMPLFDRFRSMAVTRGSLEGPVARAMGGLVGSQGLLYPRLALALRGPVSGTISLTVSCYEATEGSRVWQGYAQRSFAGSPGEPAFNRSLGEVVAQIVAQMPRPAGEEE